LSPGVSVGTGKPGLVEGRWEIGLSALVLTGLLVSMTLVILLGAKSDREITQLRQAEQTKFLATDFLMRLRTAESSQRGYLLMGNAKYLRGYNAVAVSLPLALSRREAATTAEPAQKARVVSIRSRFEMKRLEMAATLDKERGGDRVQALAIINSDRGFDLMGLIERDVQTVIEFENRRMPASARSGSVKKSLKGAPISSSKV
jgi:CHASE3 domain sensor protein